MQPSKLNLKQSKIYLFSLMPNKNTTRLSVVSSLPKLKLNKTKTQSSLHKEN